MKNSGKTKSGGIYCRYIKRCLDLVFSILLVFFLALPMILICVAIRSDSSGGAIFKQKRCGRHGRIFICYKFRTMYTDAPKNIPSSTFYDRSRYVTRVGGFLRRASLDELPQLFNVIKGDMSLVGPRPLIFEEMEIHEKRMRSGVYELRPGITGMAQINGRDLLNDEVKLINDCYYLDNLKATLDLKILIRTFIKVLRREGLEREGSNNF